jgi:hypothetical protein
LRRALATNVQGAVAVEADRTRMNTGIRLEHEEIPTYASCAYSSCRTVCAGDRAGEALSCLEIWVGAYRTVRLALVILKVEIRDA